MRRRLQPSWVLAGVRLAPVRALEVCTAAQIEVAADDTLRSEAVAAAAEAVAAAAADVPAAAAAAAAVPAAAAAAPAAAAAAAAALAVAVATAAATAAAEMAVKTADEQKASSSLAADAGQTAAGQTAAGDEVVLDAAVAVAQTDPLNVRHAHQKKTRRVQVQVQVVRQSHGKGCLPLRNQIWQNQPTAQTKQRSA